MLFARACVVLLSFNVQCSW